MVLLLYDILIANAKKGGLLYEKNSSDATNSPTSVNSLNQLATQLLQQEELRKTMTSDIAHELRTPLATLKSHMEAFEDGVWEPTPVRIHSCYEEIERLIGLISDLEDLTAMEAPEFRLQIQQEVLMEGPDAIFHTEFPQAASTRSGANSNTTAKFLPFLSSWKSRKGLLAVIKKTLWHKNQSVSLFLCMNPRF
jgi:signal transduction histidine kinase